MATLNIYQTEKQYDKTMKSLDAVKQKCKEYRGWRGKKVSCVSALNSNRDDARKEGVVIGVTKDYIIVDLGNWKECFGFTEMAVGLADVRLVG